MSGVTEGEEAIDILALRNVALYDGLQLRFHSNSLRPQYIDGFEDYMYRRNALKRARKVKTQLLNMCGLIGLVAAHCMVISTEYMCTDTPGPV